MEKQKPEKKNDCIFCNMAQGQIPIQKIHEDDNFFAIYDINPDVEKHALIISKKHFPTLLDVPNTLAGEFLDAIKKVAMNLIKEGHADGFNVIFNIHECSGQIVPHVHAHLLPRKKGDNRKLKMINGLRDKDNQK